MKLLIIAAFLVSLDAGIKLWRSSAPTSSAPVWSLDVAEEEWGNTPEIRRAVEVYGADRGTELRWRGDHGGEVTMFYIEWDQVEVGPMMETAGHAPEECNVAAGLRFTGGLSSRRLHISDVGELGIDVTRFLQPDRSVMLVYRSSWLQGVGSIGLKGRQSRLERLESSLRTGKGRARVLQAGVAGVESEQEAWQALESFLRDHLRPSTGA